MRHIVPIDQSLIHETSHLTGHCAVTLIGKIAVTLIGKFSLHARHSASSGVGNVLSCRLLGVYL